MKKSLFLSLFVFSCFNLFAQDQNVVLQANRSSSININDTTYTRILNGIVVDNNYRIKGFEGVKVKTKEDSKALGFAGNKSVMIITLEVPEIEHQVDSILYSRRDFIKDYKYPLEIRLPISIGNKLVSQDEKEHLFSKLTLKDIVKIEYLSRQNPKVNHKLTPFGVINLNLK